MRKMLPPLLLLLCLGGCAGVQKVPVTYTKCLPLKHYSRVQENQAASDLAKLPKTSILPLFMTDYARMRAADRACLGANGE